MKFWSRGGLEKESGVEGERGLPAVHRERSLNARLSSVLAAALMGVLGLSALGWYYSNVAARGEHVRESAQKTIASRAQGDAPLPALGPIDPPATQIPVQLLSPLKSASVSVDSTPAVDPAVSARMAPIPEEAVPLPPYSSAGYPSGAAPSGGSAQPSKTPAELEFERRLAAPVFARIREGGSVSNGSIIGAAVAGEPHEPADAVLTASPHGAVDLHAVTPESDAHERNATISAELLGNGSREARVLPTQRFLLPKGAYIDCTLETAVDSTLPSLTTCITATDTFGADGTVVLLERGTKLIGETRGQVSQGTARVGVIWVEARTPTGVIVPLDSPATDELGRSGLPGMVNRHFWERFGAAILITTLDGAVQAAVQSSAHGGGSVLYSPGASQAVGTEALKGTLDIPPTVLKKQGDRVQAIVARDIDFRSVYELRLVPTSR